MKSNDSNPGSQLTTLALDPSAFEEPLVSNQTIAALSEDSNTLINEHLTAIFSNESVYENNDAYIGAIELPELAFLSEPQAQSEKDIASVNPAHLKSAQTKASHSDESGKIDTSTTNTIQAAVENTLLFDNRDNQLTNDRNNNTIEKTVTIKRGDTLSGIFKDLSISATVLNQVMKSGSEVKKLTRIRPGQKITFTFDHEDQLIGLVYPLNKIDTLTITKLNNAFASQLNSKEVETKQQFATGTISASLFAAGNEAGLSNSMIMKLAQLFGWDIDFALDIRKGDSFSVLFEEKFVNGNKVSEGDILAAEFINQGKSFYAVRYTDNSGRTDYYSDKGYSMRKAFLRSPVEFSRISSRFTKARKHPVLNRIRAHKGVDYAAARGTPVRASGDGKVIYKGNKGGYGRVVILQHGSKYTTLYAHLNAYNKKIKNGARVKQGQIIGYVGSSGLATGPHLHYEFRINGVHRNPLTVSLPSAEPLAKKFRPDFEVTAQNMISQLKSQKQSTIALNSE